MERSLQRIGEPAAAEGQQLMEQKTSGCSTQQRSGESAGAECGGIRGWEQVREAAGVSRKKTEGLRVYTDASQVIFRCNIQHVKRCWDCGKGKNMNDGYSLRWSTRH